MIKIPCLFKREFRGKNDATLLREVTPGCEWVLAGEGLATRKWDGTACLVSGGKLYARYDAKKGKTPPRSAIPCTDMPDPVTGHWPHWVLVEDQPQYKWHKVCWEMYLKVAQVRDGTYELCGPHFNGNPEGLSLDAFIRHGDESYPLMGRDFDRIRDWMAVRDIEGIVFRHRDGRMCKIRKNDYGLKRKP